MKSIEEFFASTVLHKYLCAWFIWITKVSNTYFSVAILIYGSIALLLHFDKVLALSKFVLLKCKNEVNPVAWIP